MSSGNRTLLPTVEETDRDMVRVGVREIAIVWYVCVCICRMCVCVCVTECVCVCVCASVVCVCVVCVCVCVTVYVYVVCDSVCCVCVLCVCVRESSKRCIYVPHHSFSHLKVVWPWRAHRLIICKVSGCLATIGSAVMHQHNGEVEGATSELPPKPFHPKD